MAVKTRFESVDALDNSDRADLFQLLTRHFDGVDAESFESDLNAKTHILRLFTDDGCLAGFTTVDYRHRQIGGRPAAVLYSGDTIVDPAEWANASLGAAWVAAVIDLHAEDNATIPLWWLLLTSGVRTYRYLTACVKRYAPAPVGRLDDDAAALLPGLATERFGALYDRNAGVVRFQKPQRLRQHLVEVPQHIAIDPVMQIFLQGNADFANGDEFVSLARLSADNLTSVGTLSLRRGRRAAVIGAV